MTEIINKENVLNIIKTEKYPMTFMKNMIEKSAINEALIVTYGNQTKAARLLGMGRTRFVARCVEFGLIKRK